MSNKSGINSSSIKEIKSIHFWQDNTLNYIDVVLKDETRHKLTKNEINEELMNHFKEVIRDEKIKSLL
jgi:hypothetical protein